MFVANSEVDGAFFPSTIGQTAGAEEEVERLREVGEVEVGGDVENEEEEKRESVGSLSMAYLRRMRDNFVNSKKGYEEIASLSTDEEDGERERGEGEEEKEDDVRVGEKIKQFGFGDGMESATELRAQLEEDEERQVRHDSKT